jgi:Arm DNA-binding domain
LFIWDAKLPGLALLVTDKGAKSFIYQYRFNGQARRLTLKQARTVEAARKLAASAMAKLSEGKDPSPRKHEGSTIRDVTARFMEGPGKGYRVPAEFEAVLRRHIFPAFADRTFESLGKGEITTLLRSVAERVGPRGTRPGSALATSMCP